MTKLRIILLPVGQADCILIQFPDESWAMIDCGSNQKGAGAAAATTFLAGQDNRYSPIRFILATHPDKDHCAEIPGFVSMCSRDIEAIYHSGAQRKTRQAGAGTDRLRLPVFARNQVRDGRVGKFENLVSNQEIALPVALECVTLTVLNPLRGTIPSEAIKGKVSNDISVVVQLKFAGVIVLFAGDIESSAWDRVVSNSVFRPPHVLKVSHHGARSGRPPSKLFNGVSSNRQTRFALISCQTNVESKPHLGVLNEFWRRPTWRTRCTGLATHCSHENHEPYSIRPEDKRRPPIALHQMLHYRDEVYDDDVQTFGCSVYNELTIESESNGNFSDGKICHLGLPKTCDSHST